MDPLLLGDIDTQDAPPDFSPEGWRQGGARSAVDGASEECAGEFEFEGLVCRCGHDSFRLSGWPRIATAGGGFFWRSLTRVWREARLAMENGEPVESPFWLPLFLRCDRCDRERAIFDRAFLEGRLDEAGQKEPRESFRCRVCRRGTLQVVVGVARDGAAAERVDVEVFVKCRTCERPFRIAWSEGRPSAQERRLDLLYGRR